MTFQRFVPIVSLAAGTLAVAAALAIARQMGLITGEIPVRCGMVLIGLMLIAYANGIPKAATPATARGLRSRRVSGWALFVAAIVYTAAWAFAPLTLAADIAMAAVACSSAVTLAVCLWGRAGAAKA
jgi:hypothetical protein